MQIEGLRPVQETEKGRHFVETITDEVLSCLPEEKDPRLNTYNWFPVVYLVLHVIYQCGTNPSKLAAAGITLSTLPFPAGVLKRVDEWINYWGGYIHGTRIPAPENIIAFSCKKILEITLRERFALESQGHTFPRLFCAEQDQPTEAVAASVKARPRS